MLMLTRRRGESVDIVDRESQRVIATVKVIELLPGNPGSVRLGFDADQSVQFKRDNMRRDQEGGNSGEGEESYNR
jgi:sRNA-binding carbon storage regulator CsrA